MVMKLSEAISGRHHQVYFDNYFTSLPLLVKLLDQDTRACGTIRTNRKQYPKEMSEEAKRLNRGEFLFRQSGDVVAVAWKDNKVVNVVSTLASADDTTTVMRTQEDMAPECLFLAPEVWLFTTSSLGASITEISSEDHTTFA